MTYNYDTLGRLTSKVNDDTESFTYDSLSRLSNHLSNSQVLATSTYDAFSRLQQVAYPSAGLQKLVLGRDSLGRVNTKTYTYGNVKLPFSATPCLNSA